MFRQAIPPIYFKRGVVSDVRKSQSPNASSALAGASNATPRAAATTAKALDFEGSSSNGDMSHVTWYPLKIFKTAYRIQKRIQSFL